MVRAKVTCTKKESLDPTGVANLTFYPVADGSKENKEFFNATPAGQISLSIVNPAASKQFEEGKEYYVDFTPAASAAKGV